MIQIEVPEKDDRKEIIAILADSMIPVWVEERMDDDEMVHYVCFNWNVN